ncbi:putative ATP-dependent Clp protease proteolytic subunit [Aeromonas phage AVP1]|nr:putative ATP-dependent Clp protease proteolytic subunit [Aeromonas phage AVP1]
MSEEQKVVEENKVERKPWGTYTLFGELDFEGADDFNSLMQSKAPSLPMILLVRSGGGNGLPATIIADTLNAHHCKKVIIGLSMICSAAWAIFTPLQSLRLCYRTSLFMQHQASYNIQAVSRDEANMTMGVQNHITTTMDNMFKEGFGIDDKTLQKLIAKESWISSSEALFFGDRGIVDGIIAKELRTEDYIVLTREGYKRIDVNEVYNSHLLKQHPLLTEEECKEFELKQHVPVPVGLKFTKAFA